MKRHLLTPEEKLQILREADPLRPWESLDESRHCVLCERTFTGRQVRISTDRRGRHNVNCPTEDCPSTPREWITPGNPLVDDDAWKDWVRILDELSEPTSTPKLRQKKRAATIAD